MIENIKDYSHWTDKYKWFHLTPYQWLYVDENKKVWIFHNDPIIEKNADFSAQKNGFHRGLVGQELVCDLNDFMQLKAK